jgi:hypothetical protein
MGLWNVILCVIGDRGVLERDWRLWVLEFDCVIMSCVVLERDWLCDWRFWGFRT